MKERLINSIKLMVFAMIMMAIVTLNGINAYAADASITISSPSVEEGSEVQVTVTISSAEKMAGYNLLLTYDANTLEYISGADGGGNGAVKLLNELFEDTSVTRTLTFKATKAGSVAVNVDTAASSIIDMNVEDCALNISNGTVTVTAKVSSSANNYLSALEVAGVREDGSTAAYNITQRNTNVVGFNKEEQKYMAYVANDIVKFAITAVPEDATATVDISGVDLVEGGANVTTIIVTAQNGEKREYLINTYRVPSETESSSEQESESSSETETSSDTATLVDKEVSIGEDIYVVSNITEDVVLPEGFSRFEYTYEGQVYVAAKGEAKLLTIIQLVKKGTEEKALYVYNENTKVFYKFVNIQITNKMYTVTEKPEEVEIPTDFVVTLVNIDGEMLNVWANKNDDSIYMFYGMNWNGEEALYLYDSKEKTAMRYVAVSSIPASNNVTPNPDGEEETTSGKNDVAEDDDYKKNVLVMIIEAGIILVLAIALIIVILKRKDSELDEEYEEDEDEVEVEKIEEEPTQLAKDIEDIMEEPEGLVEEEAEEEIVEEAVEESVAEETVEETELVEEELVEEPIQEITEENIEETIEEETIEEIAEEEITEETAEENMEEAVEEAVEEPVDEEVEEIEEEVVLAEAVIAEEVQEAKEQEMEETKSVSIEDMLSDSSTSLNDDELDLVLDKLLGDE